jgi:hypothetical protein
LPRHRTYAYKPRYYDPVKEEFKRKLKEKQGLELSEEELEAMDVPIKERISIKDNYINRKYADQKEDRIRMYIRVITITFLLAVVYLLFELSEKLF